MNHPTHTNHTNSPPKQRVCVGNAETRCGRAVNGVLFTAVSKGAKRSGSDRLPPMLTKYQSGERSFRLYFLLVRFLCTSKENEQIKSFPNKFTFLRSLTNNQKGKIVLQEDASGFQTFIYGKLGEVIENIHTFALPNESQPFTFKMNFSYDSWNRIQSITYPDGEKVNYWYNCGGMLKSMKGEKGNQYFSYIDSIQYNEFELKGAQWYGNGTHTHYGYDTLMRLSKLQCYDLDNDDFQNITYTYDAVGNILGIGNTAGMTADGLGGNYSMSYTYDSLYRLQSSSGSLQGMKNYNYLLSMAYTSNGKIAKKQQLAWVVSGLIADTMMNYANIYHYGTTPVSNRIQSISDSLSNDAWAFTWDANGNMLTQATSVGSKAQSKVHCWDEENRLQGSSNNKYAACYIYFSIHNCNGIGCGRHRQIWRTFVVCS